MPGWPLITNAGPAVNVWSTRKSIPPDVRNLVDGRVRLVHHVDPWQWQRTDFYVQRTGLSRTAERAANAMHGQLVILPEQHDYLAGRIRDQLASGRDVWIFRASKVGDRL